MTQIRPFISEMAVLLQPNLISRPLLMKRWFFCAHPYFFILQGRNIELISAIFGQPLYLKFMNIIATDLKRLFHGFFSYMVLWIGVLLSYIFLSYSLGNLCWSIDEVNRPAYSFNGWVRINLLVIYKLPAFRLSHPIGLILFGGTCQLFKF